MAGLATVLLPPLMNSVVLVGVGSGFLLWQAFESPSSGPCPLLGRAAVDGRLGAPSWGGVRRLAKVSHPLTGEPTLKAFGRMVAEGTLQGPGQNGTTPRSTFGGLELRLEGFSGPRRQRPRLTVLAACGAALPARGPFRRELTAFFFCYTSGMKAKSRCLRVSQWWQSICLSPSAVVAVAVLAGATVTACWIPSERPCPRLVTRSDGVICRLFVENQTYAWVAPPPPGMSGWDRVWTDGVPQCLYECETSPRFIERYTPAYTSGNRCTKY